MNAVNPLTLPRTLLDFECRSELDIRDVGAWRYAEHHSTKIICLSYKRPDGSKGFWTPPLPFPDELAEMAGDNGFVFEAHNAQFEMAIWWNILHKQLGIPTPQRWADTLAVCAYRALPMGLDAVGDVLNLPIKKDKRGKYLIQQLCKPRKPLKADKKRFEEEGLTEDQWPVLWREDWGLLEEMYDYCDQDVDTEELLGQTVGDLPLPEYRLWVLDQRINKRGMYVDSEAVEAAIGIIELLGTRFEAELKDITGGAVETGSQVAKIVEWINSGAQGADEHIPNLQADTVEEWIKRLRRYTAEPGYDESDADVLRVLEIRQILGSSSVKKLYKFRACLCDDNYIRGLLQYCGAGTGRWSGRLVQPQNFPRGNLEYFVEIFGLKGVDGASETVMNILIETIKIGGQDAIDALEVMFGDVIDALTTALRGMFIAAPGKKYHVADFAAIEAVVTAWVGGEEWKLEAFRAIQRGEKYEGADDIYCATAAGVFGHIVSKKENPKERQVGKVCLSGETPVITARGVKPLHSITKDDIVWDGVHWVEHNGLADNGIRETIEVSGTWMTPDHKVSTTKGWAEAQTVAFCPSTRESALETGLGSLLSLRPSAEPELYAHVTAVIRRMKSISATSVLGGLPDVADARRKHQPVGERITGTTRTSARMTQPAEDFSTESPLPFSDVEIPKTNPTSITAAAESGYTSPGLKIGELFSSICSLLRGTTFRTSKWTGSKLTVDTSQETYASVPEKKTCLTSGKSQTCKTGSSNSKKRMRVYDLVNAGPRKRFTILTAEGPMVVHNCELAFGYQGGVGAWRNFDKSDKYNDAEVDHFKIQWREKHPATVSLWYGLQEAAVDALRLNRPVSYRMITFEPMVDAAGKWLTIILPNGRRLWYFNPQLDMVTTPWGKEQLQVSYEGRDNKKGGRWGRIRTYGGMITENVVQAISRDLMAEAMINVEKAGYSIVLTVHDEIISEDDEDFGSQKEFEQIMSIKPKWVGDCPVGLSGWEGYRYRKE